MSRLFKKILIAPILFNLFTGPNLLLAAANNNSNLALGNLSSDNLDMAPDQALPAEFEQVINELDRAEEKSLPQKTKNTFYLAGQSLDVLKEGRKYDLGVVNLATPTIIAPDFDRNVKVTIDPKSSRVSFDLIIQNQLIARHFLPESLKVISFARDKEIIVLLTNTGALYALDSGYLRTQVFKSPIPLVHLVDVEKSSMEGSELRLKFLSRGLQPYEIPAELQKGMPEKQINAGDLVLLNNQEGKKNLVRDFDRDVIKTQLYTAEAILSMLAFQVAPGNDSQQTLSRLSDFMQDEKTRNEAVNIESGGMPQEVRQAMAAIPQSAIVHLMDRAATNKSDPQRTRDSFSIKEWADSFTEYQQRAQTLIEQDKTKEKKQSERLRKGLLDGDFGSDWQVLAESLQNATPAEQEAAVPRVLFHRFMTAKAMKTLATIAVGGAALTGLYSSGAVLFDREGAVWATHLVNEIYDQYIPPILKDATYRVTLLKSSLSLSSMVPLMWAIGLVSSKVSGLGWTPIKSLLTGGIRIYGAMVLAFYHRLARVLKQPNFLNAMKLGVSPLTKITKESPLGKHLGLTETAWPGLNKISLGKSSSNTVNSANSTLVLEALAEQQRRSRSLAWTLALIVAGERAEIDPATLGVALQLSDRALLNEKFQKISESQDFKDQWLALAEELSMKISQLKKGQVLDDINNIDPKEIADYYQLAKTTAESLKSRNKYQTTFAKLKIKWNSAFSKSLTAIANFSIPEYEILKAIEPNDFIQSQAWKQFVSDYLLSVAQMGLIGSRADLKDPQALAADENRVMWTNPGHRVDMLDQVRIYGIDVPARMTLVYQVIKQESEESYDPIENLSFSRYQERAGFLRGILSWIGGAGNITKAKYGSIWMKGLTRKIKTMQAGLIMSVGALMVFGEKTFAEAFPIYLYSFIWGTWQYGWLWEPINRGNQIYGDSLEAKAEALKSARTTIGRGLRLNDGKMTMTGTKSLINLYSSQLDSDINEYSDVISQLETYLGGLSVDEIQKFRWDYAQAIDLRQRVNRAVRTGDLTSIRQAQADLFVFASTRGNPLAMSQAMGLKALEHSLKKTPFATKPHPGIEWMSTIGGALITTWWATSMSVEMFRPNIAWSEKILDATILSGALYAGTYYGEKALMTLVNKYNSRQDSKKSPTESSLESPLSGPGFKMCQQIF